LFRGTRLKIITHFFDHVHESLITTKIQTIFELIEKHGRRLFQVCARQFEDLASVSAIIDYHHGVAEAVAPWRWTISENNLRLG